MSKPDQAERAGNGARIGRAFLPLCLAVSVLTTLALWQMTTQPLGQVVVIACWPVLFNLVWMIGLHWKYLRHNPSPLTHDRRDQWPDVAVIIPSRNEPLAVATMTLDCALAQDYPGELEICVVDNSDPGGGLDQWRELLAKRAGQLPPGRSLRFIHRNGTEGFKPRNLDLGVKATSAPWVLFLDVDSTIDADALSRAMGELAENSEVGFAQLHTLPGNASASRLAGALAVVQAIDRSVLGIRFCGGFPVFYGHNGLWRRQALEDIGHWEERYPFPERLTGWPGWLLRRLGWKDLPTGAERSEVLVTEDIAASWRALDSGWQAQALWIASGEWVPISLKELRRQWTRWSVGTFQVSLVYGPATLRARHLSWLQRVDFFHHLLFYVSRALVPLFALAAVVLAEPAIGIISLVGMAASLPAWIGWWQKNQDSRSLPALLLAALPLGAVISLIIARASLRMLIRIPQDWEPTGKLPARARPWLVVMLANLDLLLVGLGCLLAGLWRLPGGPLWSALPAMILGLSLLLAIGLFGRGGGKR